MIVPASKLLFWTALVALPFAILGAVAPSALAISMAAIAALIAVALLDAILAQGRLDGMSIAIADITRLTQTRAGAIAIDLINGSEIGAVVRLGLALPAELDSSEETLEIRLPRGHRRARIEWPVAPAQRGTYRLAAGYLECASPFGFWLRRVKIALAGEIRVYPNLLPDCRRVAPLFLARGGVGVRRQRQVGKGREFEKLRDYIRGDALGDVHWKATAKRHRLITKTFQIERTQEVYFAIDASRLSARPAELTAGAAIPKEFGGTTILDRFLIAALVACLAAERQGDLFGLIVFSDRVQRFLPARNGREHYSLCRDAIYDLQPGLVTPDFGEFFTTVRARLRRRSLIVCLTNLDDPALAESFESGAELIGRRHLLVVDQLRPRQAAEIFSNPDASAAGDLYIRLAGHLQWQQLHLLEKGLARRGVRFSLLEHESLVPQLIGQYLNIKQRQIL